MTPAAHYMMGGIVTDLRGRCESRATLRVRRGLAHRGSRRQPARIELAARGAGVRRAGGARHDRTPKLTSGAPREEEMGRSSPVDRGAAQVAADDIRQVMWELLRESTARAKGLRWNALRLRCYRVSVSQTGATEEANMVQTCSADRRSSAV